MSAWYNEIDPFAADWLENLISAGLIAPGVVDRRSIKDVEAADLAGYDQHHFFAGIGGWSYALRSAGWPDDRPCWTGSCPCQPFSAAGKRQGFADDRHLWPEFRRLIAERSPPVVFGEQVASAADWLRLVRGDLEALGYAVGAIPIEAASAGADHLRNRFWFVADGQCIEGGERHDVDQKRRRTNDAEQTRMGSRNLIMADAHDTRSQGRLAEPERAGERAVGPDGVADADQPRPGEEREQRGGQLGWLGGDQGARDSSGALSNRPSEQVGSTGQPREHVGVEWVIGADGKARRVKPGVCLLAHGIPGRVGLLRGFGNAIDPRPAAQFIGAFMECAPVPAPTGLLPAQ